MLVPSPSQFQGLAKVCICFLAVPYAKTYSFGSQSARRMLVSSPSQFQGLANVEEVVTAAAAAAAK